MPEPRPPRSRRPAPAKLGGLLREILTDPERDHCPGANPVVSITPDDDDDYRRAVRGRTVLEARLARRGVDHGRIAALAPAGIVPKVQGRKRRVVAWRMRWHAAKPIPRPGYLDEHGGRWQRTAAQLGRMFDELANAPDPEAALRRALRAPDRLESVTVGATTGTRSDERDLVRLALAGPPGADAWVKLGRLSTHPADRSLRLRFGFGNEVDDDASADEARHRLVHDLAAEQLPGGAWLLGKERLAPVEELAGCALFATQPIVYWNAPQGGALFHHDAFDAPAETQQRGVLYVQLEGRTAWLAAAIGDLALRVREFLESLDGEAAELRTLAGNWDRLVTTLGEPGCGALGQVVNDPAFTAFLADSGHAAILEPGDAIVLPNFGLDRTAMHSVFCASNEVATGLSVALRADAER